MNWVLAIGLVVAVHAAYRSALGEAAYMDEIFHIPQTQQFCAGNFSSWDPAITTFPGVYLIAAVINHPLARLGLNFCEASNNLRALSAAFAIGNAWAGAELSKAFLGPAAHPAASAWLVLLAPVHFFTSFLFYTDSAGAFFSLLCVLCAARGRPTLSGAAGFAAVLCRQTNIAWAAYAAGILVLRRLEQMEPGTKKGKKGAEREPLGLIEAAARFGRAPLTAVSEIGPHLALAGLFGAFVVSNGGSVVVGHHDNHTTALHLAQVAYLGALVAALFWFPVASSLAGAGRRGSSASNRTVLFAATAAVFAGMILMVLKFSIVHPFLLADNRHYTFYLWRILSRGIMYATLIDVKLDTLIYLLI